MDRRKYIHELGVSEDDARLMRTMDLKAQYEKKRKQPIRERDVFTASERVQLKQTSKMKEPTTFDRLVAKGNLPHLNIKELMKTKSGIIELAKTCLSVAKLGEETKNSIISKSNDIQQEHDFLDQEDIQLFQQGIRSDEELLVTVKEWIETICTVLEDIVKKRSLIEQKYSTKAGSKQMVSAINMKTKRLQLVHKTLLVKLTTTLHL